MRAVARRRSMPTAPGARRRRLRRSRLRRRCRGAPRARGAGRDERPDARASRPAWRRRRRGRRRHHRRSYRRARRRPLVASRLTSPNVPAARNRAAQGSRPAAGEDFDSSVAGTPRTPRGKLGGHPFGPAVDLADKPSATRHHLVVGPLDLTVELDLPQLGADPVGEVAGLARVDARVARIEPTSPRPRGPVRRPSGGATGRR